MQEVLRNHVLAEILSEKGVWTEIAYTVLKIRQIADGSGRSVILNRIDMIPRSINCEKDSCLSTRRSSRAMQLEFSSTRSFSPRKALEISTLLTEKRPWKRHPSQEPSREPLCMPRSRFQSSRFLLWLPTQKRSRKTTHFFAAPEQSRTSTQRTQTRKRVGAQCDEVHAKRLHA
eukprot:445569-Rhodomonas_salina.3